MVLTLQLSILCKGHQRLMLVGDLLIQDCIQAFLQHTANGRSLKAQCHHIMSINCQVLECEAALFLQDLIDHLRYFLKDCDPVSADGRLTKRICLVQLDQLPGSILTVLAQKPFDWLPVGRDGHVMIANESYNLFFAGVIEAKSTEDTVRKKLKEYEELGLLRAEKRGREVLYRRSDDSSIDLDSWKDALAFYSEADPLGVVGSFLMDKLEKPSDIFRFKHHYVLHALDSNILCDLLLAISERRAVELSICSLRNGRDYQRTVCPLKIYSSTQSGRQYLLGYHYRGRHLTFFRLDAIKKVTAGSVEKQYEKYLGFQQKFDEHLWGVSTGQDYNLDHIEMTIHFDPGEDFILHRLDREKRHGRLEILDEQTCRFVADVYDASEMLPWIRTFIGRRLLQ